MLPHPMSKSTTQSIVHCFWHYILQPSGKLLNLSTSYICCKEVFYLGMFGHRFTLGSNFMPRWLESCDDPQLKYCFSTILYPSGYMLKLFFIFTFLTPSYRLHIPLYLCCISCNFLKYIWSQLILSWAGSHLLYSLSFKNLMNNFLNIKYFIKIYPSYILLC